ncbi:MAG: Gfo/Idh/MocA family oxidoreductase [Anaerolineae bacterium]
MERFRWGILATGNISTSMAAALQAMPEAEMIAVGSRSQASADAFGEKWGIPHRYASYEAVAADPEVDVIYIGTPHSHHYENMLMCLEAGKHVLCEKAFTLNARQAQECIDLARRKGLFLMEAMWMRFIPAIAQVRDWVAANQIGDVRLISADFCFPLAYDPAHRLYDPALGGGALLDLGIYPISFTTMLLGLPDQMTGHAHLSPTGVDEMDTFTFVYDSGASAQLSCSMRLAKPQEAIVAGTEGYIRVHEPFFRPDRLTLAIAGQEPQTVTRPFSGNGYAHEVAEVHACLRTGRTESAIMPLDETLALMRLMDDLRADWGVRYPGE